jgi:catechol 2,3-dioxygenase-like lactoylglutathione lyase family enzyme
MITITVHHRYLALIPALIVFFAPIKGHGQNAPEQNVVPTNADAAPPTLRIRSFTIIVRDYDEAKKWYLEKLGFVTLIDRQFGAGQRFVLIAPPGSEKGDVGFVLEKARRDDPTMPADYTDRIGKEVNIVLTTNDLSRLCAEYRDRGIRFRQQPKQQPWGGEALIEDLYGNSIVLVGPLTEKQP